MFRLLSFYTKKSSSFSSLYRCSTRFLTSSSSMDEVEVERVFSIITTASSPAAMQHSLTESRIFLSNQLIDSVLKRVRFSHANPLLALHFFYFTHQRHGFYHTAFSFHTMLYTLGRSRHFTLIWNLLADVNKKDPTLITPTTLQIVLARIAKVCSVTQTVESFSRFKQFLPRLDTACFNGLLRTLCQEKSMTDARNVYRSLRHKFKPDLHTFNIILAGWKSYKEAEEIIDEMTRAGVQPDIVSYNSLIDVYCKEKELNKAYAVFNKMQEENIHPDVITYTSMIGGLGLVGQPDKAKLILKEMHEHGCYPDVAAYNATIRNFCIAKRLDEAYRLLDEMRWLKDLMPNATTYNLFFRHFYWSNDLRSSWNLYQRMMKSECLPNTQTCMFLIRLMKRQENVEMALMFWDDMINNGFGSYTLVSDVLFDLLCDFGKLADLERCFLQMIEKGHKPSNVSFKRLKVLMELANQHQALQNVSEKMSSFGPSFVYTTTTVK